MQITRRMHQLLTALLIIPMGILFVLPTSSLAGSHGGDEAAPEIRLRERERPERIRERMPREDRVMPLRGKHVAFLVGEGFHDGETFIPMAYLINQGARITVIGVEPATVTAYNSEITARVHRSVSDVDAGRYDALVIPGGRSPDWLRQHEEVVAFARDFFETGKPVAAICHGPQVLITAGVMEGRAATCFAAVADELKEAGAEYADETVVRDDNLITSRNPDDIPAFSEAIKKSLLKK